MDTVKNKKDGVVEGNDDENVGHEDCDCGIDCDYGIGYDDGDY